MKFSVKSKLNLSDTLIPDLFITDYMSNLQDVDIKVYLFIIYLAKQGIEIEISAQQ